MATVSQNLIRIRTKISASYDELELLGAEIPEVKNINNLPDSIRSLGEATEKNIEFIDYDGTEITSYSFEEAAALTALPSYPTEISGYGTGYTLVNEGWNYSLSEVTAAAANEQKIIVGCTYKTSDGATRFHITVPNDDPYIKLAFSQLTASSLFMEWGDGNSMVVGSTSPLTRNHTYQSGGDYTIKISQTSAYANKNTLVLGGNLGGSGAVNNNLKIKSIELGNVATISNYTFNGCDYISALSIPNATTIGSHALDSMVKLKAFVIPKGMTSVPQYMMSYDPNLKKVSIPTTVTSIEQYGFMGCAALDALYLYNVSEIGDYSFKSCGNLHEIAIPNVTKIPFHGFDGCGALSSISANISEVMGYAFINCPSLTSIGTNPITNFGSGSYVFSYSYNISEIGELRIPANSDNSNKPTIGTNCFQECKSLRSITVKPDDSTNELQILANAFNNSGIRLYDFSSCTKVPTLSSTNAFASNPVKDKKILIPSALSATWPTAGNWAALHYPILSELQEFDATSSYAVGDYCIHDTYYYRCKTATSGNWNANRWEECQGVFVLV